MERTYPFAKISLAVKDVIAWNPFSSYQPIKPLYPEKPSIPQIALPPKPIQPILEKPTSLIYRIPLILAIIFSAYQCSTNENRSNSKNDFFALLTITLVIGLIVLAVQISKQKYKLQAEFCQNQKNYQLSLTEWQKNYESVQQEHSNLIKAVDREFAIKVFNYENTYLPKFNQDLENFNIYTKSIDSIEKGNLLKIDKLSRFSAEHISKANNYESKYEPFAGVSESNFYYYLRDQFNRRKWIDGNILFSKSKTISNSNYLPDILIEYSRKGEIILCIDVEIDEPYVGSSGIPIHFIDAGNEDENRDNFFLKNNWLVIRFCEEQIVRQPEKCCNYILGIILQCIEPLGNEEYVKNLLTDIKIVNCWTKDQAHSMAFRRYRNTYLGRQLSESMSTET